jgi:hypothetical protein
MLHADALLIAPLLLALNLATGLNTILALESFSGLSSLLVFDRVIQLLVMAGVALRWTRRFEQNSRSTSSRIAAIRRICVFGFGVWCLVSLPRLLAEYVPHDGIRTLLLLSMCVGVFWCLRYYFFFTIAALLARPMLESAHAALTLSRKHPQAAIRSLIGPLGVTALLTVSIFALQPDGRSVVINGCAAAAESIFWLLSTYTALAFAVVCVDDYDWRRAGLNPYRTDRLKTIESRGRPLLAAILTPATGLKLLVLGVIVLIGSLVKDQMSPPAVTARIEQVTVSDYKIAVTLEVSDPQYHFRGFKPAMLSVRTKAGTPIADELTNASLSNDKRDLVFLMPVSDGSPRKIYLEFRSKKSRENLVGMDNAWLWYQRVPLLPLVLATTDQIAAIPEGAELRP